MNQKQWIILGALAIGVFGVFSCLAGLGLGSLLAVKSTATQTTIEKPQASTQGTSNTSSQTIIPTVPVPPKAINTPIPTPTTLPTATALPAPTRTPIPLPTIRPPTATAPPVFVAPKTTGCPQGCTEQKPGCAIKGNISVSSGEKIYHLPGQRYYESTKIDPQYGERWFCTETEAIANGWRPSSQ